MEEYTKLINRLLDKIEVVELDNPIMQEPPYYRNKKILIS